MTDRPDLVATLRHYGVEVNEARREQLCLCVSHSESKPSMSVNLDRMLLNCHSCGFGGDAWTVIMEREKIDFREAVAFAERTFGYVHTDPQPGGRKGIDGRATARRGGYRPAFKRSGLGI